MATDAKRKAAEALLHILPLPGREAGWAREARAAARTRLLEAGAPMRRDEYWKYTDPGRLAAPVAAVDATAERPAMQSQFGAVHPRRLRFVNGQFRPDLSDPDPDLPGLAVTTLSEALQADITPVRDIFGRLEAAGQEKVDRPLAALNTACATEGLVLHVTGPVAEALHLRHDQVGEGASMMRHVIRVEPGAALLLLESGTVTSKVIEIDIADGGSFQHVRIQEGPRAPSTSHVFARLGAGAQFKTFTLTADGELTRNEVVMEFAGAGAVGHIAGAVLCKDNSHIDNTVFVTHGAPGCESRQVFKNVLTDKARAVFQGKIFVRREAQQTDGYQISQAVLLGEGAQFSAKPELEIYADDVKCSHGSTTGRLDEAAMFYLRSRGIPEAEAEAILVAAFAEAAFEEIENEDLADAMRAHVQRWILERGGGAPLMSTAAQTTAPQGGLVWRTLGAWAGLRAAMRAELERDPSEGRLLYYAVLSGLIGFLGRAALLAWGPASPGIPPDAFNRLLGAELVSAVFYRTLMLYAVAGFAGWLAHRFGGTGTWRETRAAMFWGALVAAPAVLAAALFSILLSDVPGRPAQIASMLGALASAWVLANCLAEAHDFAGPWRVLGVIAACAGLLVGALYLLGQAT